MSYVPVVPLGGFAGWSFLGRTLATQKAAHAAAAAPAREASYFREKIGAVTSAEDLVSDRRLLQVALGAFGLGEDIDNRFFIQKVLADGTLDATDLANRLADKRYAELSRSFGFGDYPVPATKLSDFADRILAAHETQSFEAAVGEVNSDMRLALYAQRKLGEIAQSQSSPLTKWFTILGSEPLRSVFETAYGLPAAFATLDIDRQAETLRARTEAAFGDDDLAQFSDPAEVDKLLRLFLARSSSQGGIAASAPGASALTLLQTSHAPAGSLLSLLA